MKKKGGTIKINRRLDEYLNTLNEEERNSYGASQAEIAAYLFDLDSISSKESSKMIDLLIKYFEGTKKFDEVKKHRWFESCSNKKEICSVIKRKLWKSNNIAAKYLRYLVEEYNA